MAGLISVICEKFFIGVYIMQNRYNHLNEYLKNKFGERVLKICIDGGFTCPNRDGKCGYGGCIFCGEAGSGEHLNFENSISEQVRKHLSSYRGERANKFIIYFQNFTNTYGNIEELRKKYDSALIDERIVGLEVATRPDCITEEIAQLLNSYKEKYYVVVELGLQTSNDKTAEIINRGYKSSVFTDAVNILNKFGIDVVAHIMIGLPGENEDDLMDTVKFINAHNIQGVKIHSTYIIRNTKLEEMYMRGEYKPLELDEYINLACLTIGNLDKNLIIHRISGDAPKDILVAPDWNLHKKWIMNGIEKRLKEEDIYQGKYL